MSKVTDALSPTAASKALARESYPYPAGRKPLAQFQFGFSISYNQDM